MANINFPFQYERLNRAPIDVSDVFSSLATFQTYLASGPAYAGQICAVRTGANEPELYRVNENFTYSPVGEGGGGVPTFVYRCTGTGDGIAIAKLITDFLNPEPPAPPRNERTLKLIISGEMNPNPQIVIGPANPRDATVFLDFADCTIPGTPGGSFLSINNNQKFFIDSLRIRGLPASQPIWTRGQVTIRDAKLVGRITLQGASRLFAINCELGAIEVSGTPTIIVRDSIINGSVQNRASAYIDNSRINGSLANLTDSSVLVARDSYISGTYSGRGRLFLDNCDINSIYGGNGPCNLRVRNSIVRGNFGMNRGTGWVEHCQFSAASSSIGINQGTLTVQHITGTLRYIGIGSGTLRLRHVSSAGGIYNPGLSIARAYCLAENCTFSSNNHNAVSVGRPNGNSLILINCTITSGQRYGIYGDQNLLLDRCRITGREAAVIARHMVRIMRSRLYCYHPTLGRGIGLELGTRWQGYQYQPAHIIDSYIYNQNNVAIVVRQARTGSCRIAGCMIAGRAISPIPGPDDPGAKEGNGPAGLRVNAGSTGFHIVLHHNFIKDIRNTTADLAFYQESAGNSINWEILGNIFGQVGVRINGMTSALISQSSNAYAYFPQWGNLWQKPIHGDWYEY